MSKEKVILVIIVSSVITLAFVVILSLLILGPAAKPAPTPPVIQASPTLNPPTPVIISYDQQKRDQLVEKIAGKKTLSATDTQVKSKVLSSLYNSSGVVKQDPDFTVVYLKTPDLFQVEIATINYLQAKGNATNWFLSQGFSTNGICNLPIQFYLSAQIKTQLKNTDINFNPLPEGC